MVGLEELDNRFGNESPDLNLGPWPFPRHLYRALAGLIDERPDSREKSLALTRLEESMMWLDRAERR